MIVSQNIWTSCDVHFEKQISAFGLGLGLVFRITLGFCVNV